jgi:hypothetical protein
LSGLRELLAPPGEFAAGAMTIAPFDVIDVTFAFHPAIDLSPGRIWPKAD